MLNKENCYFKESNNIELSDFIGTLDYNLSQQERVDYLNKMLNSKESIEYFEDLFEQRQENGNNLSKTKLVLSQDDPTYSETNTAKTLERLANYLIYAPDGEKLVKKTKYNFFKDEAEYKKRISSKVMFLDDAVTSGSFNNEAIDFLLRAAQPHAKSKKQTLHKDDLKNPILKEYENSINILKEKMNEASNLKIEKMKLMKETNDSQVYAECKQIMKDTVRIERKYGSIIKSLKDDQLLAKVMLFGTIYFKQAAPKTLPEINYDEIDFDNKVHIRELLRCGVRNNLQNDLDCIITDVNNIIKDIKLTPKEKKVLHLLRADARIEDIVNSLEEDTYKQYVNMVINKIIKKISKAYNLSYKDWYYLNVEKGEYYRCSSCKQQKLKHYFSSTKRNAKLRCTCCEQKAYEIKKQKKMDKLKLKQESTGVA